MSDATPERCPKCSGEGVLDVNGALVECTCSLIRRLAWAMPAEIRMSPVMKRHATLPILDMVNRSLYIRATTADMRSVIKATIFRHNGLHVRTTSDMEIRNVGVGSTSRKAKGEDATDVYNDFVDLMGSPPLVVVWLNRLFYKNKAAPGFLMEALTVRFDKRKPTWVVSDLDLPFGPGSHAFSDAVWSFLNVSFQRVEVPRILKFEEDGTPVAVEGANPVMSSPVKRQEPKMEVEYPGQQAVVEEPPKQSRRELDRELSEDAPDGLQGMGSGNKKSRGFQRRS